MAYPGGQTPVYGCAWHPDRATALRCVRCGRPVCPDCARTAPVGQQCVACVSQGTQTVRTVPPPDQVQPWITWTLIAINVLVYIAATVDGQGRPTAGRVFSDLVLYLPQMVGGGQLWRAVTSGFLHLGLIHLGVNMFSLFMVGPGLESALGKGRYSLIYGTALLGGSVGALWLTPDVPVAGASAAIYGLLGAALVIYLHQRLNPRSLIIVLVLNMGLSVTVPGISLAGHLGGLLFGALSGAALLYYRQVCGALGQPELARRPELPWILGGAVVLLAVALILVRVLTFSG